MLKFWFSGEVQGDIYDEYRLARKEVVEALNAAFNARDIGIGVESWDLIPIIRAEDHPDYDEVRKYDRKDKSMEFRLKINHERFKAGSSLVRRRLIMESVIRSVKEADGLVPKTVNLDSIAEGVLGVAREKGWLPEN